MQQLTETYIIELLQLARIAAFSYPVHFLSTKITQFVLNLKPEVNLHINMAGGDSLFCGFVLRNHCFCNVLTFTLF